MKSANGTKPIKRDDMTYKDIYISKRMKLHKKRIESIYHKHCPGDETFRLGYGPKVDWNKSYSPDVNGMPNGCRGITCEQCWNQEYEEDAE